MAVKIKNLTNRPVLLRLNSGQTLRLDPRGVSSEVREMEIKSNVKIQKLQVRSVISLQKLAIKMDKSTVQKKEKMNPQKKKNDS